MLIRLNIRPNIQVKVNDYDLITYFIESFVIKSDLFRLLLLYGKTLSLFHLDGHRCPSDSESVLSQVGAQCLLLSVRQWERVNSSVMRLPCGEISEVMMSSLDGEVAEADSFCHHKRL